ncbi:GTP-binding protein Di-Ras2 isoform X2 [Uranotaenia lowii]|uniref:GTP-binding protein Di-Ras2 isoform X2 n=1 Tax=Uranotaenia lowii TaxID=190385 RepID=UPI002479FA40|nr:GTP-binding protein Di-Ras2 isoform X2 [Uranotaenia lowii]
MTPKCYFTSCAEMSDFEHIRLVILGGAGVGKSCIIKRFLFKNYSDKYRPTVEDLYNREYDLGPVTLKVDILDTSGEMQFPAMRRLSIANAHAFLMVYATTSEPSLNCVKQCFEEIREQRADFQNIPMVFVGNKSDLSGTHREVRIEDVSEWVYCELPKLKVKVMECSAKDDINIVDIFKTFLTLSRIIPTNNEYESSSGLKRRSSAYVSASSKAKTRLASPSIGCDKSNDPSFLIAESSQASTSDHKSKPRSRSLIRRSSRKTKQQIQNAGTEDCNIQ